MGYEVGVLSSKQQIIFEGFEVIQIQNLPEYRAMKQENTDSGVTIMSSG